MSYITICQEVDVEIDLDDYADDIPTKWLIKELRSRNAKEFEEHITGTLHPDNVDYRRKVALILENLHKFSYDEIHEIFTTKKY